MIERAKYPCDLHTHTTRSDGHDTPYELLIHAKEAGLSALGLCDHDVPPPETILLPDGSSVKMVEYAATLGMDLVPGCEYSCDTLVDDVHLCAWRPDWQHPDLLKEVENAQRSKIDGYRQLCDLLTQKGYPIDWETEILHDIAGDGSLIHRSEDEVQRKHIFEKLAQKFEFANWSEAKVFIQNRSDLNIRRRKIDPVAAIEMIHRANGFVTLAHPFLIGDTVSTEIGGSHRISMTRGEYIERLIEAGLDGIEASYTYDKTTYRGDQTPEEIEKMIRQRYGNRLRIISGGSDYHADDSKKGGNVRFLGERGISREHFQCYFGN